jgi:hypothetical protein
VSSEEYIYHCLDILKADKVLVLQKQQTIDAKQSEWQNELVKSIVETGIQAVKDFLDKKPQSAKEAPKPASKKSTTKK